MQLNQRYDDIMKAANKAVEKAKREGHSSEEEVKQAFDNAVQAALVKAMYLIAKVRGGREMCGLVVVLGNVRWPPRCLLSGCMAYLRQALCRPSVPSI